MKYFSVLLVASLLTACATTPSSQMTGTLPSHTIMKEGGLYSTSGYGISKDEAKRQQLLMLIKVVPCLKNYLWLAKWIANIKALSAKMSIKPLIW